MRPVAITTLCTMVLFLHGGFLKAGEERSVIDEIPELAQALKFMEAGEHERSEKLFARGEARLRDLIQGALKNDRKARPQPGSSNWACSTTMNTATRTPSLP